MSNLIACPNCRHEIAVNEVLETQLSDQIRRDLEAELRGQQADVLLAKKQLADQELVLKEERESLAAQVGEKVAVALEAERAKVVAEAQRQAKAALVIELDDRAAQVEELQCKLSAAQHNELELRKKERELEAKAEELKLTVARELDAERSKIRDAAMKQFADEHQLKDAESQKVISDMRRQIDDLKRKAEQGSMQTQGEVQELALEAMLETSFGTDCIEPVGKGINGADCKQSVYCPGGTSCGSILWESKRTKSFSKAWLPKLRDDQRTARASVSVLVTQAMPEGVDTFTFIDGVWVCSWQCAKGLAMALRSGLIDVGKNKLAAEGRVEKTELVYNYLSGQEFVRYVEGIVEAFVEMESDLAKDKRAAKTSWNRREKQIERMVTNTAALYGDLQGIVGASMPVVEGLALPRIEDTRSVISLDNAA